MSRSQRIRQAYISTGATAGLILAGMAPAALFGYSLYAALVADGWLPGAAFIPGFSLAVTMEVVGSVSAHVAQHYPQRRKLATAALVTYTLIGLVYMLFFEPDPVVQRAGVMAYLCAPLLYVSVALLSAMERDRETAQVTAQTAVQRQVEREAWQLEQEAADRELARQLKLQRQADNTTVKLAKVKANTVSASTEPAQSKSEPAEASYECEDCNRSFGTVQALNAHGRFCSARVSQNGKQPVAAD